jgi:acetyl esterase/lipase
VTPRSSVPPGVKALPDLEYGKADGKPLLLDLFLPDSAKPPVPLIVWIHGGAWLSGSRKDATALSLATKGYGVASIDYRLSSAAIFPAQIHDCKAAVRWLRANAAKYGIDADRIGAWGSSAGGHLVALLGTTGNVKDLEGAVNDLKASSRVQAVVDWFGPTDFAQMNKAGSKMDHDAPDSPESRLIGGPVQSNLQAVAAANPITYVASDAPPFLIMHGDQDKTVPFNQSELLCAALKKAGADVTFLPVTGAGHGFRPKEALRPVIEFFDKHLKKN